MVRTWRYEDLTWEEINEAVAEEMIPVLPVGAIEQHGQHLPLKCDRLTATAIAEEAARRNPSRLLFMPPLPYGYTHHVMDFPGTINIHHEHFINYVLDITKSLAYHGFKRIIIINGHGSNMPLLDIVARRTILETDAICALMAWWNLLTVDPEFKVQWRESVYPGGCAHACELETSILMYLDPENVQKHKIVSEIAKYHDDGSRFQYVDLFGQGPVSIVEWTSTYTDTGTCGEATKATPEKGRLVFEEAVKQLVAFSNEFHKRPIRPRRDHHLRQPKEPVPG